MRCGDRVRVHIDPLKHPGMRHFRQGVGTLGLNYGQLYGNGEPDESAWTVIFDDGSAEAWYPPSTISVLIPADDAAELRARRMQDRDSS